MGIMTDPGSTPKGWPWVDSRGLTQVTGPGVTRVEPFYFSRTYTWRNRPNLGRPRGQLCSTSVDIYVDPRSTQGRTPNAKQLLIVVSTEIRPTFRPLRVNPESTSECETIIALSTYSKKAHPWSTLGQPRSDLWNWMNCSLSSLSKKNNYSL